MIERLKYKFLELKFALTNGGVIDVTKEGFWHYRYPPSKSLRKTCKLFDRSGGETIIEVGSGLHGEHSGNSLLKWLKWTNASEINAVDNSPQRIGEISKALLYYPKSCRDRVHTHKVEAQKFLSEYSKQIDLLYLDFWVDDVEKTVPGTSRENAYLKAYMLVRNKFREGSLILIDDTDHILPWKHSLIIKRARRDGFKVLHVGRQTLLQLDQNDIFNR